MVCQDASRRIKSYDGQDLFNNIMMYGALVYLDTETSSSLWLQLLCLSPAQLMR